MFRRALDNGITVTVIALIVCTLGIVAMFRVPVQMIPDMDITTLSIETLWPGASPQDIEREILIEQEEYLRSIPGLVEMTSEATTGRATIELEFSLDTELNEVLIRANNALAQVPGYPENVDEPRILASAFSDNDFMFFQIEPLPGNPKQLDIVMQRDFVEDYVKTAIERAGGVGEVGLNGGAARQVRVYVDPARLAERRITVAEVRDALRGRNRDVSGGDLDAGKRRYLIRTVGRFRDISQIADTIVAHRDGAPVYLRDVGSVELTHEEIRTASRYGGVAKIGLSVKKQRGQNVIEVQRNVEAVVAELNATVLADRGLVMNLMHSDVRYVREAVRVVSQNLVAGGLLAVGVLLLFLRSPASTFIGALGIPVCTIAAFLGLLVAGRSINVISLAGVAFAIGMTLDNSIVVLENIHRHLAMGKSRYQAALDGVSEVWTAVLASTLTTVFVFIPVMLVEEEAGQLYSDIAIAISAAVMFSMLVAVTLVPTASARWARGGQRMRLAPLDATAGAVQRATIGFVGWLMRGVLRRVLLVAGALAAMAALSIGLMPQAEYLPEGEEPITFSFLFAPPGYNFETMLALAEQLDDEFVPQQGADPAAYDRGEAPVPAISFLLSETSASSIVYIIGVQRMQDIQALVDIVGQRFAEEPGMISFATRGSIFAGNDGGTRSIELQISGPQLEPLFALGMAAFGMAQQALDGPQIRPQPSSLSLGQPMLEIRTDWERAAELGIRADELGYLVWALADGAYVDDYYIGDRKVDLFLYGRDDAVQAPADLDELPVYAPAAGGIVPLSAIAETRSTVNTETIRRVDGQRTVSLQIIPPPSIALETAAHIVERDVIAALRDAGEVPPGVQIRIGGASDDLAATRAALSENMLLAVLLAYFLMVVIFRHWGYPIIIMLTVPLGIGGGIFGLWLMNQLGVRQPFDMITMLGFLVLIGVVVNNPILLVEQTVSNIRAGMQTADAVVEATRTRVRPIMMTTLTTIFGISPLVFVPRAGTELYRGLGIIVLFGLLFSTLITLTFMPSLLSLVLQARDRLRGRPAASAAPARPSAGAGP